ncbi:MAG: DUF255 domain-containing protein [Polyangiales bacterium]
MRPLLALVLAAACAHVPAAPPRPRASVAWRPWGRDAFTAARAARKLVLVDGSAAWCHWCHVMDATTYADPAVAERVAARFVAVRFDAEERLDLTARYRESGWPATVILTADGAEVLRHRGYLAPGDFVRLLDRALAAPAPAPTQAVADAPVDELALATAGPWIARSLDALYDPELASWGAQQKVAIGFDVAFELRRAAHGDADARARAVATLRAQRALYDPVWGGVYQYAEGRSWAVPHYEKLMTWQAQNLEALADAWRVLGDPARRDDARSLAGYVLRFLRDDRGAFLATQDADVNAHGGGPFVEGRVFYAADDAGRRRLGLPRVDPHVYARENGLAVAALASLHAADPSPTALAAAQAAAEVMAETHLRADGAVAHQADDAPGSPRYLADAAALGRGYAVLAETLSPDDPARARHVERATRVAREMLRAFGRDDGALAGHTVTDATLAVADTPEEENILAARFLAALGRVTGDDAWRERARRVLAVMVRPAHAAARGRFVGDLLLALDECGLWPWEALTPGHFVRTEGHATVAARLGDDGLTVTVTARDGLHVNVPYPASLTVESAGAALPARLTRAQAARVDEGALVFHAAGAGVTAARGAVAFALCGETSCAPETRAFVVTAP